MPMKPTTPPRSGKLTEADLDAAQAYRSHGNNWGSNRQLRLYHRQQTKLWFFFKYNEYMGRNQYLPYSVLWNVK